MFIRIKRELQLRAKNNNLKKVIFTLKESKKKIKVKQTQIEEIIIPEFLNDIKIIQISNNINSNNSFNCNSSPSLSTTYFEEEYLKEDIEKLNNNNNNVEDIYNKNPKFEKEEYEEVNYIFPYKNNDFNFDYETNFDLDYIQN